MVNRVGSGTGYRIYDSVNLANNTSDQVADNAADRKGSYSDISAGITGNGDPGVVLDLSTDKKTSDPAPEAASAQDNEIGSAPEEGAPFSRASGSLIDTFRNVLRQIGDFFNTLWNGSTASAPVPTASDDNSSAASDKTAAVPSDASAAVSLDSTIHGNVENLPRTDDIDSIRSYLNDYDGHRLAHDSGLLTSYDRFGRLVEPNVSDKDKILRGDSSSLIDQLRENKK